jgi:hypothetical protein
MTMTWKKLFLYCLVMAVIAAAILTIGPWSSKKWDERYRRKIDENGIEAKGRVIGKSPHRGRSVLFRYRYNGKDFSNYEGSKFYYSLEIGDSVIIKINPASPGDSYIIDKL